MSWRFRKSFSVIPGLRLNLSKSGLSATVGGAPFSLNVSQRGLYGTASLPGSGLSYRTRLDHPVVPASNQASPDILPHESAPLAPSRIPETHEIRSASTEALTSEHLRGLKDLIAHAKSEHDELETEIKTADWDHSNARRRFDSWNRGFLFKRLFPKAFAERTEQCETATAKLDELREQLRLAAIATEFSLPADLAEPYFLTRDEFSCLSTCHSVWDVLSERATNRVAERTIASSSLEREPVTFSLTRCDLIQWDQKVPYMQNRRGGDLYIYPGFILYRASREAFSVIDSRELSMHLSLSEFVERESVPADSKVVGHTWHKANKDGSPDRRFSGNYQIPLAQYAHLKLTTPGGLHEEYLFSNVDHARRFVESWVAFMRVLDVEPEQPRALLAPQ